MSDWRQDRKRMLDRLGRMEGQVRGVLTMIDRDDECEHEVQQFDASRKTMVPVFFQLETCITRRKLAKLGISQSKPEPPLDAVTGLQARYS